MLTAALMSDRRRWSAVDGVIGAAGGRAFAQLTRNAKFKRQNANKTHLRKNGVYGVTAFTPTLQTSQCLHLAFCILNYGVT
jgi:hypothetical protein